MTKRLRRSMGSPVSGWINGFIPWTTVPEAWARPIGFLCIWHSSLELLVDRLLAESLEVDLESALIIRKQLPISPTVTILKSAGARKFSRKALPAFNGLVSAIEKANDERNWIVHSRWAEWSCSSEGARPFHSAGHEPVTDSTHIAKGRVTALKRGKGREKDRRVNQDQIVDAANQCFDALMRGEEFLRKYCGHKLTVTVPGVQGQS